MSDTVNSKLVLANKYERSKQLVVKFTSITYATIFKNYKNNHDDNKNNNNDNDNDNGSFIAKVDNFHLYSSL